MIEPLGRQIKLAASVSGFNATHVEALLHELVTKVRLFPTVAGEVGVTDQRYPYGHAWRYGALTAATSAAMRTALQNAMDSASATGVGILALPSEIEYVVNKYVRAKHHVRMVGIDGRATVRNDGTSAVDVERVVIRPGNYVGDVTETITYDTAEAIATGDDKIVISGTPQVPYAPGLTIYICTTQTATVASLSVPYAFRFMKVKSVNGNEVTLTEPMNTAIASPRVAAASGTGTDFEGDPLYHVEDFWLENLNLVSTRFVFNRGGWYGGGADNVWTEGRGGWFGNAMQGLVVRDLRSKFWRAGMEVNFASNHCRFENVNLKFIPNGEAPYAINNVEFGEFITIDGFEIDMTGAGANGNLQAFDVIKPGHAYCKMRGGKVFMDPAHTGNIFFLYKGSVQADASLDYRGKLIGVEVDDVEIHGNGASHIRVVSENNGVIEDCLFSNIRDRATVQPSARCVSLETSGVDFKNCEFDHGDFYVGAALAKMPDLKDVTLGDGVVVLGGAVDSSYQRKAALQAIRAQGLVHLRNIDKFRALQSISRPSVTGVGTTTVKSWDVGKALNEEDILRITAFGNCEDSGTNKTLTWRVSYAGGTIFTIDSTQIIGSGPFSATLEMRVPTRDALAFLLRRDYDGSVAAVSKVLDATNVANANDTFVELEVNAGGLSGGVFFHSLASEALRPGYNV